MMVPTKVTIGMMVVVGLLLLAGCQGQGNLTAGALTDVATSKVEGRAGLVFGDKQEWETGVLATWFAEESETPWGAGGYLKWVVEPEATIPVANWLPAFGAWLNLPETVTASTYLIAKGQVLPYEESVDFGGSFGAGAQLGPAVVEFVYDVLEGGDSDAPALASGPTLWLGAVWQFQ